MGCAAQEQMACFRDHLVAPFLGPRSGGIGVPSTGIAREAPIRLRRRRFAPRGLLRWRAVKGHFQVGFLLFLRGGFVQRVSSRTRVSSKTDAAKLPRAPCVACAVEVGAGGEQQHSSGTLSSSGRRVERCCFMTNDCACSIHVRASAQPVGHHLDGGSATRAHRATAHTVSATHSLTACMIVPSGVSGVSTRMSA